MTAPNTRQSCEPILQARLCAASVPRQGVGLAGARLAVGEDADVDALQDASRSPDFSGRPPKTDFEDLGQLNILSMDEIHFAPPQKPWNDDPL